MTVEVRNVLLLRVLDHLSCLFCVLLVHDLLHCYVSRPYLYLLLEERAQF